ncbi:hypothetical protein DFP73DRAFT_57651 [Morchella snyderi]|nr:hypothetical protein DFP73DRAFT_57651 [Morchella snyderi]
MNWMNQGPNLQGKIKVWEVDLLRNITSNGLDKTLSDLPAFGGVQLVICGDFFQLPPVDVENNKTCYKCGESVIPIKERKYLREDDGRTTKKISHLERIHKMGVKPTRWTICTRAQRGIECGHLWNETVRYCFQTQTWSQINFRYAFLTKVHRQDDQKWIDMLSRIKIGEVTDEVLDYLVSLNRPLKPTESGIVPTRLYSYRRDVERENLEEFNKLNSKIHHFTAVDQGFSVALDKRWSWELSKPELEAQRKGPPPNY